MLHVNVKTGISAGPSGSQPAPGRSAGPWQAVRRMIEGLVFTGTVQSFKVADPARKLKFPVIFDVYFPKDQSTVPINSKDLIRLLRDNV